MALTDAVARRARTTGKAYTRHLKDIAVPEDADEYQSLGHVIAEGVEANSDMTEPSALPGFSLSLLQSICARPAPFCSIRGCNEYRENHFRQSEKICPPP